MQIHIPTLAPEVIGHIGRLPITNTIINAWLAIVIFLIVGFLLISLYSPKISLWIKRYAERHKGTSLVINKMEKWLTKFIGEI